MWNVKKNVELIETERVEWWLSGTEGEGDGDRMVKGNKLPVIRWVGVRGCCIKRVTIVSNAVLIVKIC